MPSDIKKVAVVGAGALGAAYGGLLFDADRQGVAFVAAGERLERLRREGLVVNGRKYDIPVLGPDDPSPPADLVLVAVKYQDLDDAIRDMKGRIGKETVIMSVMNGIDSEERIGAAYGMEHMLYAVSVGIDALRIENRVTYTNQGKIYFGEAANPHISERVRKVQALFDKAGIVYETPADMLHVLWWKYMINVGINQASAVLRAPYGVFQTSKDARELMAAAMREVVALAEKLHIALSEQDMADFDPFLMRLSPQGKTSMLQDVEAGRKTEVEMLAGKVIDMGRRMGVSTPVNQMLYDQIKKIEMS
jgi:2-dehydropantoate 2-reductase